MKILKNAGRHRILAILFGCGGEDPLELIEVAGRTAYQSRDKITAGSAAKFVEMIRKSGHESVLEHSSMTVEFSNVSRGFTHQLVRHRLAAYTQESTRYVDKREFEVILPPHGDEKKRFELILDKPVVHISLSLENWLSLNEQMYRALRHEGWKKEEARQILPIGIRSQIVMTANFREWRHVLKLRNSPKASWEIRFVMKNLVEDVKKRIPVIFDDI
jgi:thymidylate synthase (FAD)